MVLKNLGPPSSPPTAGCLLSRRMRMAQRASIQKMVTENPRLRRTRFSWIEKRVKRRDKPSDGDIEGQALGLPVDSSHGPCDSDTEEHVDSVGSGNISNRVVRTLVFNGSCLGGKGIWGGEKRIRLWQCSGRQISPTPRPRATHLLFSFLLLQRSIRLCSKLGGGRGAWVRI